MLHLSKRIEEHKPGIKLCLDELDHATRELLEEILVDEEEHVDWIESQLHIIKEAGFDKLSRPTDPRKVKENPGTPRR